MTEDERTDGRKSSCLILDGKQEIKFLNSLGCQSHLSEEGNYANSRIQTQSQFYIPILTEEAPRPVQSIESMALIYPCFCVCVLGRKVEVLEVLRSFGDIFSQKFDENNM